MVKPQRPIRRYDVFAEYNRQRALKAGLPDDEAKGYAIWLAKEVAAHQKDGPVPAGAPAGDDGMHWSEASRMIGKWRALNGEPQTDILFNEEIIERMGDGFYYEVFLPAIQKALKQGMDYTQIRDTIRQAWKP